MLCSDDDIHQLIIRNIRKNRNIQPIVCIIIMKAHGKGVYVRVSVEIKDSQYFVASGYLEICSGWSDKTNFENLCSMSTKRLCMPNLRPFDKCYDFFFTA